MHVFTCIVCLSALIVCKAFISSRSTRQESSKFTLTASSEFKPGRAVLASSIAALSLLATPVAHARPEGVNRPDLLPKEQTSLIDVANFLTKGQEKKVIAAINQLQQKTGVKFRILCQAYPETPGLAIKDYWGVDDNTLVMVVDKGEGFNKKQIKSNIINLNIGSNVEILLPNQFWLRLQNKLGNVPYVQAAGEDTAILNAVEAITYCLEEANSGGATCKDLPFDFNVLTQS